MSSLIVAQLLFLESENPKKDIFMYINSPGGVVTSGLAIHDTMQYIRPRVGTGLWLGDRGALTVTSTVLDVHEVERGDDGAVLEVVDQLGAS